MKAHRLVYHSILEWRVIKKKNKLDCDGRLPDVLLFVPGKADISTLEIIFKGIYHRKPKSLWPDLAKIMSWVLPSGGGRKGPRPGVSVEALRPTVGNTVAITTPLSVHYPKNLLGGAILGDGDLFHWGCDGREGGRD